MIYIFRYPEVDMMSDARTLRAVRMESGECTHVEDDFGYQLTFMADAREILRDLAEDDGWKDTVVVYVSRTTEIESAEMCLSHLHVCYGGVGSGSTMEDVSHHKEIYPGSKVNHFLAIRDVFPDIPFHSMVFFDNERRNTSEVSSELGVISVWTPKGLTRRAFDLGLQSHEHVQECIRKGKKRDARKYMHVSDR